ncbi:MAG: serine/threonine protein kinase, partial [Planctomycetes bacterium]|nr:serine/threonine protein kinase [Planctomycetota bacterium]
PPPATTGIAPAHLGAETVGIPTETTGIPPATAGAATIDLPPPSALHTTPPPGAQAAPASAYADAGDLSDVPARLGPFEVLEKLGQGGMGAVYKARDPNLGRIVALKVLAPALRADKEAADRFLREARAAAAVNHPNVITVHAVAGPDDPEHYMALEYLPGGDAEALAERHGGRLPEPLALEIMRDCARGLVAIERAGLVHRDLKPANIFVTADGTAKLADLGLARNQAGDDRMTVTGTIVGTPAFMAPEQARAEPDLDIRTDIYSLGASLFGLLAGKPPFVGSSAFVVVSNLLNKEPPKLGVIREDLHPQTLALIKRAMAKDREDRFPDAPSLLQAVEQVLVSLEQGGGGTTFRSARPPQPGPAHEPTHGPGRKPHMSTSDVIQKSLMIVGAVVVLLTCCCMLFIFLAKLNQM